MRGRDPGWRSQWPYYYGWVVVGTAAWSFFFTAPGQTYSYSIFIDSFIADLEWSRTLISSIYSAATLISGLTMSVVGRAVDRLGAKTVCIAAGTLLGVASLWSSFLATPSMLFIGFFLGRFAGQGTLALAATTLAPRWFVRRRALAIMLASFGSTGASIVFPVVNSALIDAFGWRIAFRVLAVALWAIYLPPVLILMVSRPERIGLRPFGAQSERGALVARRAAQSSSIARSDNDYTQKQALRTAAFWIVSFAVFQFALIGTGTTLHFLSILETSGFDSHFAARLLSARALAGFIAVIVAGIILERSARPQLVLSAACALQTVEYVTLAFLSGPTMAYGYAFVSGTAAAVLALAGGVLNPHLFGRRYIGGITGALTVVTVVGSSLGPTLFGAAFDRIGGYREALFIAAAVPMVASILAIFARKPRTAGG